MVATRRAAIATLAPMSKLRPSNVVACVCLLLGGCGKPSDGGAPPATTSPAAEAKSGAEPEAKPGTKSAGDPKADPTAKPVRTIELAAGDGSVVHADHYALDGGDERPLVLLFHQAGWNAGEYEPIAPRLQSLGMHALAIDQRSGGERDGRANRTVDARGKSTEYLDAYPDLVAALGWAKREHEGPIVVWGSSYSAALVFKLAGEHAADIAGVLAFSPGEYIGSAGTVAGWARAVEAPVFVTSAPGKEVAAAKTILASSPSARKVQHEPTKGVHGSSILREDKNPGGTDEVWSAVETFLGSLG